MSKVASLDLEKEIEDYQQKENEHDKPTREVLEELATDISRRWLGIYAGLDALPGIIGTAMLGISAVEMVLSTGVRMTVLYAWSRSRSRALDGSGDMGHGVSSGHYARQVGSRVGPESEEQTSP